MTTRAAVLDVMVVPRASRNAVRITEDGSVRIWVTRPPADGEANRAVLDVLAGALDCPPSSLEIMRGDRSRRKRIRVAGLSQAEADARLSRRP